MYGPGCLGPHFVAALARVPEEGEKLGLVYSGRGSVSGSGRENGMTRIRRKGGGKR